MKPYVWDEKEKRAKKAQAHYELMEKLYKNEIDYSIKNTKLYESLWRLDENLPKYEDNHSEIILESLTTSQAIEKYCDSTSKISVLNFASYRNPGGMFMYGSRAQEECLCHDSTLYNVLSRFKDEFYDHNLIRGLGYGLYSDRSLYSPDIIFDFKNRTLYSDGIDSGIITKVDVITTAAPNAGNYLKHDGSSKELLHYTLTKRIETVINIGIDNSANILILGAFGCGVFKNDPREVAEIFKSVINEKKSLFKDIKFVFAIPVMAGNDKYNENYIIFREVLLG